MPMICWAHFEYSLVLDAVLFQICLQHHSLCFLTVSGQLDTANLPWPVQLINTAVTPMFVLQRALPL